MPGPHPALRTSSEGSWGEAAGDETTGAGPERITSVHTWDEP